MSEPDTAKVAHVRRGSPVLLHLHTRADDDGVVILSGRGEVSERSTPEWLPEIGEAIAAKFHVVLVVVPTRLQAW